MTTAANKALLRHRTGDYERHAEDWYVEPGWCWDVLFSNLRFSGLVLDPACGGGVGLSRCREHGLDAIGSDIVDRGCGARIHDFLTEDYPLRANHVISNPPYKLAAEFARKALAIGARDVALLVPLPFLASQRRRTLFTHLPVRHVIVLSKRPSMPPGGGGVEAKGGKEDFCWCVWHRGQTGAPTILWGMP
jgi:hypothetical protein